MGGGVFVTAGRFLLLLFSFFASAGQLGLTKTLKFVWFHVKLRFYRDGVVRGRCRVVALQVFARYVLADFFRTISHCPWRDFISFSNGEKETKQRKRLSTDGT
ncbi:hypothetical protein AXG89_33880 [Burkholderia sp. PAMC 26561]|nr:hypothetical protein AXG89_33880 [Burkholderia sp. PAMC 26561]